jgi:histone H3/H4
METTIAPAVAASPTLIDEKKPKTKRSRAAAKPVKLDGAIRRTIASVTKDFQISEDAVAPIKDLVLHFLDKVGPAAEAVAMHAGRVTITGADLALAARLELPPALAQRVVAHGREAVKRLRAEPAEEEEAAASSCSGSSSSSEDDEELVGEKEDEQA